MIPADPCPCGSTRAYAACCRPFVVDGEPAPTAEALMRSRYTAYALGEGDHLFRTWHPRTRPADTDPDPALLWNGLDVVSTEAGSPDDDEGIVEFRAHWTSGAGRDRQRGVLHECSNFVRRSRRWLYVDGEQQTDS